MKKSNIYIVDSTLREGLQTAGIYLSVDEKIELIKLIDSAKIPFIEIHYSEEEFEKIQNIKLKNSELLPLIFMNKNMVESLKKGRKNISKIVFTFPIGKKFVKAFLGRNDYEMYLKNVIDFIDMLVKKFDIFVAISNSFNFDEVKNIKRIIEIFLKLKVKAVILSDSKGIFTPIEVKEFIENLEVYPEFLGVHFHNDFGMATANAYVAASLGIKYITATINGLGEKAGITPIHEIVSAVELLLKKSTGINLKKLIELSIFLEKKTGIFNSPKSPVIGSEIFKFESGIPIKSLLYDPSQFNPIEPSLIGREIEFLLGKYSGKHIIRHILREMGYKSELGDKDLKSIKNFIKEEIRLKSKHNKKLYEIIYDLWHFLLMNAGVESEKIYWWLENVQKNT